MELLLSYVFDEYRNIVGIVVKGMTEDFMDELGALNDIFDMQDTTRFLST